MEKLQTGIATDMDFIRAMKEKGITVSSELPAETLRKQLNEAGENEITFESPYEPVLANVNEGLGTESTEPEEPKDKEPEADSNIPDELENFKPVEFTITTKAGENAGMMVRGTGSITNDEGEDASDKVEKLEYFEVKDENWYEMPATGFGAAQGFPLADATSKFRVTFKEAGVYNVEFKVVEAENEENVIVNFKKKITVK